MSLRRKLFKVWCGFTVLWWLICIFGGDGNLILLKFQIGGWRAAYVHLAMTTVISVGVPIAVLLIGRVVVWGLESRIRTEADSNQDNGFRNRTAPVIFIRTSYEQDGLPGQARQ
jgi:hypothetical protein